MSKVKIIKISAYFHSPVMILDWLPRIAEIQLFGSTFDILKNVRRELEYEMFSHRSTKISVL